MLTKKHNPNKIFPEAKKNELNRHVKTFGNVQTRFSYRTVDI